VTTPVDEVVDLVSALIRFDTSNTGELETTKGEAECARWVAEQLREVGYETEYVESGAPGRGNGRYQETYWSKWPNVWVHGDWARVDDGGFWFGHGRSDDTIKIAGKRIGPADFESALVSHDLVTEAVAIGIPDEMKGESVVCFVTVHDARRLGQRNWRDWEAELIDHVGRALGKPLRPSSVYCVDQIPKTRNGKLLRRLVRSAYLGTNPGDLSTVENPASIDQVANCRKVL